MKSINDAIDIIIKSAMVRHGWDRIEAEVFVTYAMKNMRDIIIAHSVPPFLIPEQ